MFRPAPLACVAALAVSGPAWAGADVTAIVGDRDLRGVALHVQADALTLQAQGFDRDDQRFREVSAGISAGAWSLAVQHREERRPGDAFKADLASAAYRAALSPDLDLVARGWVGAGGGAGLGARWTPAAKLTLELAADRAFGNQPARWRARAAAQYDLDIWEAGHVLLRGEAERLSGGHELLSLRAVWITLEEAWRTELFADNLTDQSTPSGAVIDGPPPMAGRTFGLAVTRSF